MKTAASYTYKGWNIAGSEGSFTAHKGATFLGYGEHVYTMCDRIDAFERAVSA